MVTHTMFAIPQSPPDELELPLFLSPATYGFPRPALVPANPDFPLIYLNQGQELKMFAAQGSSQPRVVTEQGPAEAKGSDL